MAFEQARQYLARVIAWPQGGEDLTYCNIHWSLTKNDARGKPIWTGRATRSLDEAVRAVDFALKGSDTKDIYVCLSTQRRAEEKVSRKGFKYLVPVRGQENAVALKSLFIDIDAKPGPNGYDTMEEAVTALGNFIQVMGLPKPSVTVSSGGGLHVYWTLSRALTLYEWQPLAFALAEATKKHGLRCDAQCTIDGARVLRIPDTFNRKLEQQRNVRIAGTPTDFDYTVERLEKALEPYKVVIAPPTLPPRPPLKGVSDLSAGVDMGNAAPIDLDGAAKECGFVREAIATNGMTFSNPLWNLTTLIATFSKGGRADAHRMASAHPGYTKDSTDELFDRKEREKDAKGLGWPSCRTISASGHAGCAVCPHYSANKSPLNFAPKPISALATPLAPAAGLNGLPPGNVSPGQSDLPSGYKRAPTGCVNRVLIREDGTQYEESISSYPMTDPWLQKEPAYTLNFSTVTEVGRPALVAVPLKEAASKDGLRRCLWSQGLPLRENETKNAMEFFVSWIEKLQKSKDAVVSSAPFGWSTKNGKLEGFIYGDKIWSPAGDRTAAMPDAVIAAQYSPTGDRESWVKASELITSQGRPALDAIIASAFAGPLVRFTGEAGVMMSTYSQESGIGKTSALKVAQAVWGDPIRAMQGLSDTQNSVANKIGELRSLPLYWDELKTDEDTKKFVKLVFQLTSGKDKARMTQGATQRHIGTWQTMLVSASNDSILDCVLQQTKQTTAGLYRVFEYEVPPPKKQGQVDPSDASQILGSLNDNYGVVGLEYAQFLGRNHDTIGKEVATFHKAIGQELGLHADERFWKALITIILMGAKFANQLKLTQIDEAALKDFMVQQLKKMRGERSRQPVDMKNALNVSNTLAQFINAMRARHTIRTNRIHTGRGKPQGGTISVVNDASKLDAIYVHIGVDDKMLRFSSTFFSQWLQDHGYSRHMFIKSLENEMGAKMLNARIGAGTQYAGATEYLIEINLMGTQHVNFIDEA